MRLRSFVLATAAAALLGLAGCNADKDYSKEAITPPGQPNPNLVRATPGGMGDAGGGTQQPGPGSNQPRQSAGQAATAAEGIR